MTHDKFHIQHDEKVLIKIRKHWFVLFRQEFGVAVFALLPLVFSGFAMGSLDVVPNNVAALFLFFISTWLLLSWIGLAIIWTNHYLDMWIITDQRIVYVEQVRLFVRETKTLTLSRVQDATVRYNGFIETILDFGTMRVQTAGAMENDILMHGVPHPNDIKHFTLAQVDRFSPKAHTQKINPIDIPNIL
jgi:hypothetical protein